MPETVLGVRNNDRRTHIERINSDPERTSAMTDAQFAEIKALLIHLLTPGYEVSKLYLAQANAAAATQGQSETQLGGATEKAE